MVATTDIPWWVTISRNRPNMDFRGQIQSAMSWRVRGTLVKAINHSELWSFMFAQFTYDSITWMTKNVGQHVVADGWTCGGFVVEQLKCIMCSK